ncbi:MAG: serine/threonine-protein kinase, partial [Planctomycetota bacterium]
MSSPVSSCPTPDTLDAIAAGASTSDTVRQHIAHCSTCAEHIDATRFAQRFATVLNDGNAHAPPATDALPDIFGYRVLHEVSRGGQGIVYRAVQRLTGQDVAIKVLHPSGTSDASRLARLRMIREIQIVASLQHPGIVRLKDALKLVDGRDALVMEFVDGIALDAWACRREIEGAQVLHVLADVAEALHHAHQRGVIHRDLKPSNILIDRSGRPHLLDFGIAGWTEGQQRTTEQVTRTGEFMGTLAYAAPEQVAAEGSPPDVRSDVYALGVIGYQALTGRMPYNVDGSLESVIRNIKEADVPGRSASGLPMDPWTVLHKATSKAPSRRYQSAAELASDLHAAASGTAISARRDSRLYTLRMTMRHHRVAVVIVLVMLAGLIGVLTVQGIANVRLNEALRISRLQQARAHILASERLQAEPLLWRELDRSLGSVPIGGAMWSGTRRQRDVIWALAEMQSRSTCVGIDQSGVDRIRSLATLDDGSFGVIDEDARVGQVKLIDEQP